MRLVSLSLVLASTLAAQGSVLTTTFAGGNSQNGNMFDITAVNAVVISGFDIHMAAGTHDVEVYVVTGGGTFLGKETNASAWTLVGTATGVASNGVGNPTPLSLPVNVPIAAGQSVGFYVTTTNSSLYYTNGSGVGAVYAQDANIQFREGVGKAYPFLSTYTPRVWNGRIYYALAGAQSLTTTFGGVNSVSAGNMFDVTALQNVVVTGCDVSLDPGTWDVAVYTLTTGSTYVGSETNPSAWTLLGSASGIVSNGFNVATPLPFALNSSIGVGQSRPFYITVTNGNGLNYIAGTSAGAVYVQDASIQIREGVGLQTPFATPIFTPRVWNGTLRYATIPLHTAVNTALGAACGYEFRSFYEQFSNGAPFNNPWDLNGLALKWTHAGTFYVVDNVVAAFVPPTAAAIHVAPGQLDGQQEFILSAPMPVLGGTTSSLNVCTKGYVATAVGNGIDYTPTGAELLAFPQQTWACWADYNQALAGSGLILFEQIGNIAYVTWNGVRTFGNPTVANTFQFQFNVATGDVTLVMTSVGAATVLPAVVGFSPAGASLNPGSKDISALVGAGAIFLDPADRSVTLNATTVPLLGTTWQLVASNIPANGVIGVEVLGLSDPLIDDLAVIGMPFCGVRASLDVVNAWFIGSSIHAYNVPIPNSLYLLGLNLHTTIGVFQVPPVNPFGAITSRGMRGTIGNQ